MLALYQSKKKRRRYDKNQFVHTTMNYGVVLPDHHLRDLMKRVNVVIHFTAEYFGICKAYDTEPELEQISAVADETIKSGDKAAREYLSRIKGLFEKRSIDLKVINLKEKIFEDRIRPL